jgi:hypothetical protein
MTKEQREKLILKIIDENDEETLFKDILNLDIYEIIERELEKKSDDELLNIIL